MKRVKAIVLPHWLRRSVVLHWLILFLAANIFLEINGGPNPNSRLALVFSIIEDQSFKIEPYRFWTTDWAQTPDESLYTNKAPGASFLAVIPVALMDSLVVGWHRPRAERDHFRWERKHVLLRFASLCLQIIPFLYLVAFFIHWLGQNKALPNLLQWIAVALLFGNTASALMNSFFGHALAANFLFASLILLLTKKPGWFAFSLGWAVLCDYGALFVVPFFVVAWAGVHRKTLPRDATKILEGLVIPAILWIWYHTICFGNPWTLPQRFQNPIYQDLKDHTHTLWGVISFLPNFQSLRELIFGNTRGLLYTQPWILFLSIVFPFYARKLKSADRILGISIVTSLAVLLWMNASFGQWQGGHTFGPRYLSIVFPCFGFVLAFLYPYCSQVGRVALRIGIVLSSALTFAILLTNFTPSPAEPLWAAYANQIFRDPNGTVLLRSVILIPALAFALNLSIRRFYRKK